MTWESEESDTHMAEVKKIATRVSYGETIMELAKEEPRLVVMDADLADSTKSGMIRKVAPERFFDCGIAEANMIGTAAGLAASGKIPFVSTFAMFGTGRVYEQIRNSVGYPHLNVKIAVTHAGITVGADGASHQCLEDVGLMRMIPGMVVMCPADDVEARAAVRAAAAYVGPVFLRFGRSPVPVINDPGMHFEIGKGTVVREGKDVTVIAAGICVDSAMRAAEALAEEGIDAEVISMCTIKPLDEELVIRSASKTGKVVTVEEHWTIGGLGSAVAECLSEKHPTLLKRIGISDVFGESGTADELMAKFGLDGAGVCRQIREFVQG